MKGTLTEQHMIWRKTAPPAALEEAVKTLVDYAPSRRKSLGHNRKPTPILDQKMLDLSEMKPSQDYSLTMTLSDLPEDSTRPGSGHVSRSSSPRNKEIVSRGSNSVSESEDVILPTLHAGDYTAFSRFRLE
jgi:hypothetical protein